MALSGAHTVLCRDKGEGEEGEIVQDREEDPFSSRASIYVFLHVDGWMRNPGL